MAMQTPNYLISIISGISIAQPHNKTIPTLLLVARGSSPLQENDQEYLGIIAAGGGHLSPALETQAAWLYLKRLGLAEKALAAVRPQ